MDRPGKKHILFCILNWGLGHATRSLPVIHYLIEKGHELTIASDGIALEFIRNEKLPVKEETLPGYEVNYAETKLFRALVKQGPGILKAVRKEHQQVRKIVNKEKIDIIISDSRFGCYDQKTPSYLIGHTLQIRTKDSVTALAVNGMIRAWTARFDACWVPDLPPPKHLSGYLSEAKLKIPKAYLGWLTNLEMRPLNPVCDLIVVLSGPEPLRTELENIVLDQLGSMEGKFLVIGGKSGNRQVKIPGPHIEYIPMASRQELSACVAKSTNILSRSGYSSLMDWLMLGKKMIVVPTPGQPEQEYLAEVLEEKNWAIVQNQSALDIASALMRVSSLEPPLFAGEASSMFEKVVEQAVAQ